MSCCIQSFPIDNGFTIKLKPMSAKQDVKAKNSGTVFVNPQQEVKLHEEQNMWDVWNKSFLSQTATENDKAKLEASPKAESENEGAEISQHHRMNYLNLPVISQPYNDYKVLVAAAPPNINIGSGAEKKKMLVYVVFPDDEPNENVNFEDIPKIYFVHESSGKRKILKKMETDPILIVDNNRTVTGLKSKEVPKFVRFKNKLTNRFNYNITS